MRTRTGEVEKAMHFFILGCCVLLLWLSHKFHDAYVHAVSREERSWFQRVGLVAPRAHRRHIGHRIFLAFDILLVLGGVFAWSRTLSAPGSGLISVMQACEQCSVLILGWMFLEGRHLESFYQRLARAARGLGQSRRLAWRDPFATPGRRLILWASLAWASLPAILSAVNVPVFDDARLAPSFAAFFLLPLTVVGAVITWALLPVRRLAYTH